MKLNNINLFSLLSDSELALLEKLTKVVFYAKGSIIFFEGEEAQKLLFVLKGRVAVYQVSELGNENIINTFFEGEIFAEAPCINGFAYPASAKSITDCEILEIDYKKFEEQFLTNKDICIKIILALSQKIKKLSRFINNSNKTASQKLASYLLEHNLKETKQKELASKLNIRPETLSRTIAKFTKDGVINGACIDKDKLTQYL